MILRAVVPLEESPDECQQGDALQFPAPLGVATVLGVAHGSLEPLRVAQRFRRERRNDLAEANVAIGERVGVSFRAQEDRPDDSTPPSNRNDHDRADVPQVEQRLDVREHGIVRRVGDEDGFTRFERALQLGVAIEIDDEVADRRIFVAGDEANVASLASEEDRAAVEAERLTELPCDGLQDIYEVKRSRDFLEDVDERDQLVTLALQLRDLSLQPGDLPTRG